MFLCNFLVTLILSIIVSLVYTEIHCYHLREVYAHTFKQDLK